MSADLNPERAVLGLAMASRNTLHDLEVAPDDFADTRHAALYQLILNLDKRGEACDQVAMSTAYKRLPPEERVGIDAGYIYDCWAIRPVNVLAEKYGRMVMDAAARRRLDDTFLRGRQLLEGDISPAEVAEIMRGEIESANRATAEAVPIGSLLDDVIDSFEKPARAFATPWPELNKRLVGWRAGAMYVVGARPGVGKSIVGLQAALGLAENGWVAFHSLEMSKEEVIQRAVAQVGEVSLGRLQGVSDVTEALTGRDWDHISKARGILDEARLSIDDRTSITVTDIRSHARTLARKPDGLSAIVVDYLQLMSAPRGDRRPRHEIVGELSRSLKVMAKEMGVPVIALSQLNRNSTQENRRPTMADIRESGSVEQDADVILLLHSPDETSSDMDMLVGKNRHGTLGPVQLTRRGEFARVEPRAWVPRFAPPPPEFN